MARPPTITVKIDDNISIYPREYQVGTIWYARYKIHKRHLNDGKRYIVETLKTDNQDEALWKSKSRYLEIELMEKRDQMIRGKLVRDAIHDFLIWYEKGVETSLPGTTGSSSFSPSMLRHYEKTVKLYWNEYIGDLELSMVSHQHFVKYEEWRRNYYQRKIDEGVKLHGGHKERVSGRTIQLEVRCMKTVMKWARQNRLYTGEEISFVYKAKRGKRHSFSLDQYMTLVRYMRTNKFLQKGKHKNDRLIERSRHQIRAYILFMANTGIRPGTESQNIRWRDIEFVDDQDHGKYLRVSISSAGKKRERREVIGRYTARRALERLRESRSDNLEDDDYIWCEVNGRKINSFREIFTTVIQEADVEYHYDGSVKIKHSPYCLRHTYATFRLRYTDAPLLALARNMGTSVGMIEQYYADVVPQHYVAKLL